MNLLCDAIDQKKSVERVSVILNALQRICSKFPCLSNSDPRTARFLPKSTGFAPWIPAIGKNVMNSRFEPDKIIPSATNIITKICKCVTKG